MQANPKFLTGTPVEKIEPKRSKKDGKGVKKVTNPFE
jgi:hypothetical protein